MPGSLPPTHPSHRRTPMQAGAIAAVRAAAFPSFVAVLLAAGAWQCVAAGSRVNGDAISYLDLADQYARGDWSAFRNGYWSPLYPALLGLLFRITGAAAATGRDIVVAYALNLMLLGAAIAAFAWWLRELGRSRGDDASPALPLHLRAAAWAIFAWHMLRLLGVSTITPDGLVAACWYASMALLTRRWRGAGSGRDAPWFGALLGVGYLTKAVLLPVGVVLAAAHALAGAGAGRGSRRLRVAVVVVAAFAAVSAPLIAAQSARAGHPSMGETGRLAYAWYVNRAPHPEVATPGDSAPARGLALPLASMPGALLFPDSSHGTFPYWYDASRWSPRARAAFDLPAQVGILRNSARWYRIVALAPLLLVLGVFAMGLASGPLQRRPWALMAGPIALMGIYAMVHPEGRLAGPGIASALVVLLGATVIPGRKDWLRVQRLCAAGVVLLLGVRIAGELRGAAVGGDRWADLAVARALQGEGIAPGALVAVAGDPYGHAWARMAGVHIVAVLPLRGEPAAVRAAVVDACTRGWQLDAVLSRRSAALPGPVAEAGGWTLWRAPACPSPPPPSR